MQSDHEDILLSRVVDRRASREDWDELDRLAAGEPEVWRRLGQMFRDDGSIRTVVHAAGRSGGELALASNGMSTRKVRSRWAAAAAMVLLAAFGGGFVVGNNGGNNGGNNSGGNRGEGPGGAPVGDTAHRSSLKSPELVESTEEPSKLDLGGEFVARQELTPVVLGQKPVADGGEYEVTVLRQIVEQHRVEEWYRLARNEHGDWIPAPDHRPRVGPVRF